MPIGELIGDAIGGLLKVVVRAVFELVFEIMLAGTGRWLIRLFKPQSEPGDLACISTGILFWFSLGFAAFIGYLVLPA